MRSIPFIARKQNLVLVCVLMLVLLIFRPASLPGTATASAQGSAGTTRYLLIMRDDTALDKVVALNEAEVQAAARGAGVQAGVQAGASTVTALSTNSLAAAHRTRAISALQAQAKNSQHQALGQLERMHAAGKIRSVHPLWVINAISVEVASDASPEAIMGELASLDGVARVRTDPALVLTGSSLKNVPIYNAATVTPSQNITQIGAPQLWAMGYTGKGIVVANLDTGVSLNNNDLKAKYRGGSNSWLDTHGQYAKPTDNDGHGTATMGLMVSTDYGVAPDATWIAVKIFDDNGAASFSDAIEGLGWVLDPDNNPATDDGADVVNNSWSNGSPGCVDDPDVHAALKALVAAGVLPIFSAGNLANDYSSPISTDPSPSNYPEVFAVGAVDPNDQIAYFSSQGPSSCRPSGQVFPDIVAPGVSIASAATTDGYVYIRSGTSFSAPYTAGALALLLQAHPNMPVDLQRQSLHIGAMNYWGTTPDNTYGYGMLNIYNAYVFSGYLLGQSFPYSINLPLITHQ